MGPKPRTSAIVCQNAGMRPHLDLRSHLGPLLVLAIVATGCGTAPRSASPSAPTETAATDTTPAAETDQATFAAIERQVEALRGLDPTATVTPVLLDSTGLRDKLTSLNAAQTNHVAMAGESRLFVDLGLLPAGSSLEQMELDLDAGQVIGFYDPVSKGLYVLSTSGAVGPIEKVTFSHEYTHALQYQNFGLDKLATDTADQGDRDLARTALPEGDATLIMTDWETQNLSVPDLLALALDPSSAAQTQQLDAAPAILRQSLMFPYEAGLAFVQGVYNRGGWAAVNELYAAPPDSTSQILHPELYDAGVKPVSLTVPAVPAALGSGWKQTMQDTLGELQLRVWLEGEHPDGAAQSAAASATSEWGGDRVALYEGPSGAWAVTLRTTWRSSAGATAFAADATRRAAGLGHKSRVCAKASDVEVYLASSAAALAAIETC